MSEKVKIFIELTRLNKPIGFMLLFWPCVWGLTISYDFSLPLNTYFIYAFLFFSGSVLMRSAGCIVNDISDRKIDKLVERTKNRPIASEKISVFNATIYATILCLIAFLVLINFNKFTIYMALLSMPLAFTYPLMKRFTYWPQLFLGITFNYGLVLAWISIQNEVSIVPIIFYLGATFWTLGYDTIYGYQDINDDEIIGVKSTSIKFKNNIKFFVCISYLITSTLLMYLFLKELGKNMFSLLVLLFIISLIYQIINFNKNEPKTCLNSFKINNYSGLFLFLSFITI